MYFSRLAEARGRRGGTKELAVANPAVMKQAPKRGQTVVAAAES